MITAPAWLFAMVLLAAPCALLVGAAAGAYFGARMTYRVMNGQSPVPELPLPTPADERFGSDDPQPNAALTIKLPSVRG